MPGQVIECTHCQHEFRWGYSEHAVEFAAGKRNASREEIISDFFELNPAILREKPLLCPHCKHSPASFKVLHTYP